MRQHHPKGEAHRAEAILHDPPNSEKSAFRRFFRFCAPMSDVRDENLLAGSTESQSGSG